jgi:hypothetical protein
LKISCYNWLEGIFKGIDMNNITASKEFQVALKTVNNIFDQWQLTGPDRQAFFTDDATLIRLSRILNVYRLLGTNWVPLRAANWLRAPNDYFKGKSPLEVISDADDGLEKVQQYLKYEFQDLEERPTS